MTAGVQALPSTETDSGGGRLMIPFQERRKMHRGHRLVAVQLGDVWHVTIYGRHGERLGVSVEEKDSDRAMDLAVDVVDAGLDRTRVPSAPRRKAR